MQHLRVQDTELSLASVEDLRRAVRQRCVTFPLTSDENRSEQTSESSSTTNPPPNEKPPEIVIDQEDPNISTPRNATFQQQTNFPRIMTDVPKETTIASPDSVNFSTDVRPKRFDLVKQLTRKRTMSSVNYNRPRDYNTPQEVQQDIAHLGVVDAKIPWHKTLYLGLLAGLFVSLSGIFAMNAAGGIAVETRTAYPAIPKLIVGATFPTGLFLIVLFGGELFTGNSMVMAVAFMNRKVSALELVENWFLVFISNLAGCLLTSYLFGYLTNVFVSEPFRSFVVGIAENKVSLGWGSAFLRAIPANALVCLGIFLGMASRDVAGKIIAMWFPIFAFATSGFEHCVANMFFIPIGMLYGASVSIADFVALNLIPVILGNIVGGAFLVGFSEFYLYAWHRHGEPEVRLRASSLRRKSSAGLN